MMTLRFRVTIFVSAIFSLLAISLYLVFNMTIMGGFLELEEQGARRNTARVLEGIKSLEAEVATKAEEWGTWDDSYSYIQKRKAEYEKSNLTYESLDQLSVRHFFMSNLEGKIVKGLYVNKENQKLETLDSSSMEVLSKVATKVLQSGSIIAGIVEINKLTFIIGAAPVTNSGGDAPVKGVIIFSRDFAEDALKKLEELTRTSIRINSINEISLDSSLSSKLKDSIDYGHESILLSPEKIYGVDIIRDIFEFPVRGFVVTLSRDLLAKGTQARNLVTIYILTFTIIALAVALFYLNKIIIHPLRRIANETKDVGESHLENVRITQTGDKEISSLAISINHMLDTISKANNEVKIARNMAEQANAAKSMFVARVSHELRNQVHGIKGLNDIILKKDLPKTVRDLIKMGNLASEGLLSIVSEILDFSKAESGNLTFEKVPLDVRQVIRETMQVISARLETRKLENKNNEVKLVCEINPNVPRTLLGDPTKLKQILINLLSNAIKFTSNGYVGIKIEAESIAPTQFRLKFDVWDTGTGIPAEKLETIFNPFHQADNTIERQYKGTGLGLTIVKSFTEGLGGNVVVNSKIGQGSNFVVTMTLNSVGEEIHPLQKLRVEKREIPGAWPKEAILVGKNSLELSGMVQTLNHFGVFADIVDSSEIMLSSGNIKDVDLLVINEDSFIGNDLFQILKERLSENSKSHSCVVAMLNPSCLELKEKLSNMGIKNFLFAPVLAEDLLWTYCGNFCGGPVEHKEVEKVQQQFGRKLKVLIADDMQTNKIILEEMLLDAGHEITSVSDGKEIIDLLTPMINGEPSAEKFDLVITDITMTIMNGDEAARIIRQLEKQNPNGKHLPIIAVTGHAHRNEIAKIKNAGIDEVLPKPMTQESLLAVLEKIFSAVTTPEVKENNFI